MRLVGTTRPAHRHVPVVPRPLETGMPRYTIPRTAHCDSGALTMAARVRWHGTTTQRGYGAQHQAERTRRLKLYRPGDPCAHCGWAITYWPLTVARRYVDLPHTQDRTGYLAGLAHRYCNRRDGQRVATTTRYGTIRTWQTSRQW